MLVALLMAFLLGGGGGAGAILTADNVKQISKQVEVAVTDSARSEAAAQTLAELKVEMKTFEKSFAKSGKELTKLYKDHASDGAEMVAVLDGLNDNWEAAQRRAIELRFELKDSLSREEWAAVFGEK